jgi:hypothetical protein
MASFVAHAGPVSHITVGIAGLYTTGGTDGFIRVWVIKNGTGEPMLRVPGIDKEDVMEEVEAANKIQARFRGRSARLSEQQNVAQRLKQKRDREAEEREHGLLKKRKEVQGLTSEEAYKLEVLRVKTRQKTQARGGERKRAMSKGLCEGVLNSRKTAVKGTRAFGWYFDAAAHQSAWQSQDHSVLKEVSQCSREIQARYRGHHLNKFENFLIMENSQGFQNAYAVRSPSPESMGSSKVFVPVTPPSPMVTRDLPSRPSPRSQQPAASPKHIPIRPTNAASERNSRGQGPREGQGSKGSHRLVRGRSTRAIGETAIGKTVVKGEMIGGGQGPLSATGRAVTKAQREQAHLRDLHAAMGRSREELKEARLKEVDEWQIHKVTESGTKGADGEVPHTEIGSRKHSTKGSFGRKFGLNVISVNNENDLVIGTTSTALFVVRHTGMKGAGANYNGTLLTIGHTGVVSGLAVAAHGLHDIENLKDYTSEVKHICNHNDRLGLAVRALEGCIGQHRVPE